MTELTLDALIEAYKTDPVSSYHKLRYHVARGYDRLMRRLSDKHGGVKLSAINFHTLRKWHDQWSQDGAHIPMADALKSMFRTLVGFGFTLLEDKECERLCLVLNRGRFPSEKTEEQLRTAELYLTAEQADIIRHQAHLAGAASIALAEAFQFECMFRQKDVIGEWVAMSARGMSDVTSARHGKWLRGIRWEEIDNDLVLKHTTSKKQKVIVWDLKLTPMVVEELTTAFCEPGEPLTRAKLPKTGPVIVDDETGRPYLTHKFRRRFRDFARAGGVPDEVKNRHSRHGAITEAKDAGADMDHVRQGATHSSADQTGEYTRNVASTTAGVSKKRIASRKRPPREEVA